MITFNLNVQWSRTECLRCVHIYAFEPISSSLILNRTFDPAIFPGGRNPGFALPAVFAAMGLTAARPCVLEF